MNRLLVLAYHDVSDETAFEAQIDVLSRSRRPVSFDQTTRAMDGSIELPPRAVLITFDDGNRSVYEKALPILRKRGISAVVFVVAGHIGTSRPFWFHEVRELVQRGAVSSSIGEVAPEGAVRLLKRMPDTRRLDAIESLRSSLDVVVSQGHLEPHELRELEAAGIEVGNHTMTHPCLDRCPAEKIEAEVTQAHTTLTEWLGHPPRSFAYPNGNSDSRAHQVLERLGYEAAFLFDHRIGSFPPANRFQISRVRVNSTSSPVRFRTILNGIHPFVHHALGRQ